MSLALAMVLGMTACGANGSRDSGGEKTETVKTESSGAEDESGLKVVTIGLNGTVTALPCAGCHCISDRIFSVSEPVYHSQCQQSGADSGSRKIH